MLLSAVRRNKDQCDDPQNKERQATSYSSGNTTDQVRILYPIFKIYTEPKQKVSRLYSFDIKMK